MRRSSRFIDMTMMCDGKDLFVCVVWSALGSFVFIIYGAVSFPAYLNDSQLLRPGSVEFYALIEDLDSTMTFLDFLVEDAFASSAASMLAS